MANDVTSAAAANAVVRRASFPARVSAGAIVAGSLLLALLAPHQPQLGPAMIAVLGLLLSGYSGLVDQLGASRPLARAGLVAYAIGIFGLLQAILAAETREASAYLTMGVMACSTALLLWSAGLMHRSGAPRIAGFFGLFAGAGPTAMAIFGHLALGAGAASAGVLASGGQPLGRHELAAALVLHVLWGLTAAWLLASGRVVKPVDLPAPVDGMRAE